MNSIQSYSISLSTMNKYLPIIIISVMFIFGIIPLSDAIREGSSFVLLFVALWYGILIYNGIQFIGMPSEIRIANGELATFIDIFGRESEIHLSEIQEIRLKNNILKIKSLNKKITGIGGFDGFSRFVEDARKKNPNLITKGC